MTSPHPDPAPFVSDPIAQVLITLGQIQTELAVMAERLKAVPDHEARIRLLETSRAKLLGACLTVSAIAGGGAGWISLALGRH